MRAVAYTPHTHTYTQDTHGSEIHVYYTYGGRRNRVHRAQRRRTSRRYVARRRFYAALAAKTENVHTARIY